MEFEEKTSKTKKSHHMQADTSRMSTFLDDVDSEKGACGRYKEETTCENRLVSSFITIFTRKMAPAAAITTNTQQ